MSEINSIAQGTYTLGQTSATTYQAGPGIKIDEPSAGTVRIGSDYNETKLFVASTTAGSNDRPITLAEPYTNFERIKIYFRINDFDAGCSECMSYNKYLDLITQSNYGPSGPDKNYSKGIRMYLVNDNQLSAAPSAFCFYVNQNKQLTYFNEAYSIYYVNEVIGINRISGGNA